MPSLPTQLRAVMVGRGRGVVLSPSARKRHVLPRPANLGRLKHGAEISNHPLADPLLEIEGTSAFCLAGGIELVQHDIRALQFAKGAIAAGVSLLMADLGVDVDDLDQVLLAGSFGTYIRPESAGAIGLIPPVTLDRVFAVGYASLEGARMALLSFREYQLGLSLARRVEYVELSAWTSTRLVRLLPSLSRHAGGLMTVQPAGIEIVVCGSLVQDAKAIGRARGWQTDVYAISPLFHLYQERIVEAVEAKVRELEGAYRRFVVVYGDCGTAGKLDGVLRRYGATRPEGPHCYEMLAVDGFSDIASQRPGTFFLTPWLIRNFERYVAGTLGLTEHPDLVLEYFRHFTDVVYLRRAPDAVLERHARKIADLLGLPLEIRDARLGVLERRLTELVEA